MSSSEEDVDVLNYYAHTGKNMSDLRKIKIQFDVETKLPSTPHSDSDPPSPELETLAVSDEEDVPPESPEPPVRGGRRKRQQPPRKAARGRKTARRTQPTNYGTPEILTMVDVSLDCSLPEPYVDVSLPVLEDDPNEVFVVKVCWKSRAIVRFPIRKYQNIESIFHHFANLEGVRLSQVLLTVNNKTASVTDSPDSLNLNIASIVEGGIITVDPTAAGEPSTAAAAAEQPVDKDSLELKVRQKDVKAPTIIRVKKTQPMSVLMTKFSELVSIPRDKLKFSFDGDALDPNDTPLDLDLEGGEMIDLVVIE